MSRYFTKTLAALEPYVPGEQLKIDNLVKLNANENPYPPAPGVAAAVEAAVPGLRLYSDLSNRALNEAIAKAEALKEADYTEEEIAQAAERFATMSDEDKARLTRNIIAGLPGAEEGYTLDQFRKHLELYKDIDKAKLRENFAVFLKAIIPVAEEVGVRMAVHPDDPPRPILGLPRIVSTIEDMQWMVDTVNSMANGFTMCTGSYGVRADNDLVDMIKQFGPRIYFTHLRSTMREDNPKTFHEAAHLNGDVDMYEVVKAIVEEEHRRKAEGKEDLIPMRPDHGHQMLDDLKKKTNPGYSAIGRLKGLAEVRGVELAIQRAFFSR